MGRSKLDLKYPYLLGIIFPRSKIRAIDEWLLEASLPSSKECGGGRARLPEITTEFHSIKDILLKRGKVKEINDLYKRIQ